MMHLNPKFEPDPVHHIHHEAAHLALLITP